MVRFVAAPGADAILSLVPNAGQEHRRNVQVALGHGAVEMVVSVVQGMDDVLGRGLLAVIFVVAPVIVVAFQYDLFGRIGLDVVRTRNDRHGIVLEGGNAAHIVFLAGLRPLD